MAAHRTTPLTLLTGLSTTLREPVLATMVDATTVAVVVEQDELRQRGVLTWQVFDQGGPIDSGEFTVDDDCGACQLIESLLPLLETLTARGHWRHVVLAAPPAMEARSLASALVATMPEVAGRHRHLRRRRRAAGRATVRRRTPGRARSGPRTARSAQRGRADRATDRVRRRLRPRERPPQPRRRAPAPPPPAPEPAYDGRRPPTPPAYRPAWSPASGRFDFDAAEAWAGELASAIAPAAERRRRHHRVVAVEPPAAPRASQRRPGGHRRRCRPQPGRRLARQPADPTSRAGSRPATAPRSARSANGPTPNTSPSAPSSPPASASTRLACRRSSTPASSTGIRAGQPRLAIPGRPLRRSALSCQSRAAARCMAAAACK